VLFVPFWQNQNMALLEIVKWPAPVLDTPADPVTEFDEDLAKLVSNMFETMYARPVLASRLCRLVFQRDFLSWIARVERIRHNVWR
jgi:hypothetical protein